MAKKKVTLQFEVTRMQARKILAIADRTFSRAEAEGVIVPLRRGAGRRQSVYDLAVIVPAYVAHLRNIGAPGGERQARARRDLAQAQMIESRLAERNKTFLPAAEVERVVGDALRAVRAAIDGQPNALVPQILAVAREGPEAIRAVMEAYNRDMLRALASWRSDLLGKDDPPAHAG